MICGKKTLERFQRDPKSLVGKWIAWYQVFQEYSWSIHRMSVSVWEVGQVTRHRARLFTVIPSKDQYPCEKEVPLPSLLQPENPFFPEFTYIGPRERFEWIKKGVIVKIKRPIRFYAQIVGIGFGVTVEYRPPELDNEGIQAALTQYPFLRDTAGSRSTCPLNEFIKRWREFKSSSSMSIWITEHARRLRNEERRALKRYKRLQEQQAPTPSVPPEKSVRGPSLWERIRTQAPPSDDEED